MPSYRWTEFRLPGRDRGGVRSETDPTRLHLILKRNAVIRQFGKCLMNKKNCKVGDFEKNKALRMDVGWRSDIEIPVKYVCHHPAESDRSLGDPK